MKKLLITILGFGFIMLFLNACEEGFKKEIRRQCIVALDTCEKYADVGACSQEYLKVCDGVEI